MFTITGNEIIFQGVPFATLSDKAWPTLQADAIEALTAAEDFDALSDQHQAELEAEYHKGQEDMRGEFERQVENLADFVSEQQSEASINWTKLSRLIEALI